MISAAADGQLRFRNSTGPLIAGRGAKGSHTGADARDLETPVAAALIGGFAWGFTGSGVDKIHGRDALNGWVSGIHSVVPNLAFTIEVGPITERDYLVVRWRANGTYGGGFPGAPASAVGRKVTFTGTDTLRIVDGKIAEYWANADSLLFIQQLGLTEVPATTPKD